MIISKLQGGLGNQMFQYAIARNISIKTRQPFGLDNIGLLNGEGITKRKYGLDKFNIVENILGQKDLEMFRTKTQTINESDNGISAFPEQNFTKDIYLNGYWQNEEYFKENADTIRKDFTLKQELSKEQVELLMKIRESNSLIIQIRRGDYISNNKVNSLFNILEKEYFLKAFEYIKSKQKDLTVFVVSDDPAWCKPKWYGGGIKFAKDTVYLGDYNLPDYVELYIASQAKHAIISNSSFGWFIAWLMGNRDKMVIAPSKWLKNETVTSQEIVPKSWIKM